ncbi:DNA polymerase III subunit chi [Oceanicella actignis]|uniref:DNA polymerase III subunit chi n=1 Tax=Oceanicella actignis TaxID=1189325 RepID=UPI0011E6C91F|nr:DNA polymerase III subunit chi [Oceanicella actignis]TYO90028.1 DNA polymerase III chi subunit [Oceanicella actignis]
MAEVWFYHLTVRALEDAAPEILERCVARGWRATVRLGSEARAAALDDRLWTYDPESFLPHGGPGEGDPATQPVYLTAGDEIPNDPQLLMLADGAQASIDEMARHQRTAILFDGRDPEAVARARDAWRAATAAGLAAVYWAQTEDGRWTRRAASPAGGAAAANAAPKAQVQQDREADKGDANQS